ncbi:MAG: VacJ family lipoprotein [Rhodovibrio sp.]|nr:VacJ family lipoprotein [Rhodovibrio sp.]
MATWLSGFQGRRIAGAFAVMLLLAGCAANGANAPDQGGDNLLGYEEPNDPLEVPNRFVFAFNDALDTFILKPIAVTYDFWLPDGVKDSVRNFVRNISSPVILANDVFQGEWDRANDTAARFFVNTITSLGFFDIVDERHPYHDEDFGQTLAVYGVDDGFYLVLPVFGPSSARDAAGRGVDWLLDPLTYVEGARTLSIASSAAGAVDSRARNLELFREIKSDSVDFYARVRSLYYQRREAAIQNADGPRRE